MGSDGPLLPFTSAEEAKSEIPPEQDAWERAQLKTLESEADLRDAYVKREHQRMSLREKSYSHAVAVCLGLAFYVGIMALAVSVGSAGKFAPEAQVAIFATPVVAIAAITVFLVRGVFSGFSERSFSEDAQAVAQLTNNPN